MDVYNSLETLLLVLALQLSARWVERTREEVEFGTIKQSFPSVHLVYQWVTGDDVKSSGQCVSVCLLCILILLRMNGSKKTNYQEQHVDFINILEKRHFSICSFSSFIDLSTSNTRAIMFIRFSSVITASRSRKREREKRKVDKRMPIGAFV